MHTHPFVIGVHSSPAMYRDIEPFCADIDDLTVRSVTMKTVRRNGDIDLFVYEMNGNIEEMKENIIELQETKPSLPIIIVTRSSEYETGIELLRMKITDFLVLPNDQRRLYTLIQRTFQESRTRTRQQQFLEHKTTISGFDHIIGRSPQLLETFRLTRKVIESDYMTTLILGETGTGKELLVKAIHYNSANKEHPFVEINCSAIPESLLESELFGFEKGAFTDARERKVGLFELAGKGTIFLDEIGDINPLVQSKLLKVIEEKVMRRLGGVENIPVQARIIAATSKNLEDLVHKGHFRQDLYFRLHILPLVLPPLRERESDIPLLCEHFLTQFNGVHRKSIKGYTSEAMQLLRKHHWRGNIRELKHAIERAVVLCDETMLGVGHFEIHTHARPTSAKKQDTRIFSAAMEKTTLSDVERQFAQEVLESVGGNKSQAAVMLGISRPRLDRILKQSRPKK
ncbi:MAG TPA: sigma-54 dependent transcriptional regulator [Bacteroidota bacterium]|nr:sigma-54 dependent transcriptional regulator [Bacteroidota bacterium]